MIVMIYDYVLLNGVTFVVFVLFSNDFRFNVPGSMRDNETCFEGIHRFTKRTICWDCSAFFATVFNKFE